MSAKWCVYFGHYWIRSGWFGRDVRCLHCGAPYERPRWRPR